MRDQAKMNIMRRSRTILMCLAVFGLAGAAQADQTPSYGISFDAASPLLLIDAEPASNAIGPTSGELPATQALGFGLLGLPLNNWGQWTLGLLADSAMEASADARQRFVHPFTAYDLNDDWTAVLRLSGGCTSPGSTAPAGLLLFRPISGEGQAYLGGDLCYRPQSPLTGTGDVGLRIGITIPLR